jgi:retron-type reverse transcriptase
MNADENVSKRVVNANVVSKINGSLKAIYKRLRPHLVTQMLLFLANEHVS